MDLSNFINPSDIKKPIEYNGRLFINSKGHHFNLSLECTRFFVEKGYKRGKLLTSKDFSQLVVAPTDKGGVKVVEDSCVAFGAHAIVQRLKDKFDENKSIQLKGEVVDDLLVFNI